MGTIQEEPSEEDSNNHSCYNAGSDTTKDKYIRNINHTLYTGTRREYQKDM